MTLNPSSPRASHAVPGRLVATMLVVALSTLGCGAGQVAPEGLTRSASDKPARGNPSGRLDVGRPSIGNLDPDLLDAVEAAAHDAQDDGVRMVIISGWRSRAHQERLFEDAVIRYGSEEEARRYVATPDTSAHVTGDAVDIGPTDADSWLSQHGVDYGLCQTFANEIWHYELATTPGGQCPDMFPDGSGRS